MATFCINLNIHYSAPQKIWNKLEKLYTEMPHWKGFVNGCPQWYGEPGGLQLYAEMPQEEWNEWLQLFKEKATAALGYRVGEPEDGYDFKYWE